MKKSLLFLAASILIGLASCGSSDNSQTPTKGDANWVDYAKNGSVKLNLDYSGHDFFTDGLEKVSLYSKIDGDTAHFTSSSGKIIKSRFFGIDTPESTGKVQPYGKKASHYTGDILDAANKNGTIVVSSPNSVYKAPEPDSTGSRYVSLVWVNTEVKNAPLDQLYLLNLMIVEEGLSWTKTVTDMPEYADTFYDAEKQAKIYKLNLHSGEDDPDFNYGDYEDVSLLEMKREITANLLDPSHENAFNNKKVRVQGTVAGFSNHIIYIEDWNWYTDESGAPIDDSHIEQGLTGEYAGINIFVGMSAVPSKFTTVGNYIQVSGLALDSQFGFQISDVSLPTISYNESDGKLLIKASANTEEHALKIFDYTAAGLSAAERNKDFSALNCRVSVSDVLTVSSAKKNSDGSAITLKFAGCSFHAYLSGFNYKPYPDDPIVAWTMSQPEKFEGKKFLLRGVYTVHEFESGDFAMNVYPSSSADLILQEA